MYEIDCKLIIFFFSIIHHYWTIWLRTAGQTICKTMAQRERRANAGNRMAKLLDEEEEDEFYKTTYGGFQEAEEDNDYVWVLVGSALYWEFRKNTFISSKVLIK